MTRSIQRPLLPDTAIKNADSPSWSVRAAAGRQLASSDRTEEPTVAGLLHRLLLDAEDTAVTAATAQSLLERQDLTGLRHVLLARSCAGETWTADEIQAALDCDPGWTTTTGAARLIKQLRKLLTDSDVGVRDEAQRILAPIRPREEWAQGPGSDAPIEVVTSSAPRWTTELTTPLR